MISKISLGTVQFGQDYGIANTSGKISKSEACKILDYAKSVGISYLDTAFAYGDSEEVIGEYLGKSSKEFKIVSKLPPLQVYRSGKVDELFKQSLQRLGIKKVYGYLLHKYTDILIDDVWSSLVRLRGSGQIEKIGFSLYSPDELLFLLDKEIDFDIVQIPYSVFDQRFEKCFDALQKRGVEIQARSVFLQGLAFLDPKRLPSFFQAAKPKLERLRSISLNQKISIEALCLNFVLLNQYIERVVIGVDELMHLERNIESLDLVNIVEKIYAQIQDVKIENEDVLLPYKWNK